MKIVHVVEAFAAGIAVFINSLVENMPDDYHIIIHGEREWVMKSEDVKKIFPKGNVLFIRWQSAGRSISLPRDLAAFRELRDMLKELNAAGKIDAVHLHSSKSGFLGRAVCRTLGIKNVIYTPNGAPFLVGTSALSNALYSLLEKVGSWFGGKVVCCSPSELQAYRDLGINATQINNGIPINKDADRAAGIIKTPNSAPSVKPGKGFKVITSGRIAHQKNPGLFNSIARYFEELPAFEFVWVGDGDSRSLLTAGNIQVTGWLSREQAREVITQADVYLSTALFEGLSFAGLEALHLEKPVLLTDCIGNRDMTCNGSNGDLFRDERDAVVKIMRYFNNRLMLPVMGSHSAKWCAQEFNLTSTYNQYRELYAGSNRLDPTL
jgi:glycosyltransferase involved in cell wall biosynthesis